MDSVMTASKSRRMYFHQNFAQELVVYLYVFALFYILYSFYRVFRRKQTTVKYTDSLSKLYLLNVCILLTFLSRIVVIALRSSLYHKNTRRLFRWTQNFLEPVPELLSVTAYCVMSYLFYTLYQNLTHFYHETHYRMRRTRTVILLLVLAVLMGYIALVVWLATSNKPPVDVIFEITRFFSAAVSFIAFSVLGIASWRLIGCIKEICEASGRDFPLSRIRLLMAIALSSLIGRGLVIGLMIWVRLVDEVELVQILEQKFEARIDYGEGSLSVAVLLFYFLYYFLLELLPCVYIAYRLSPRLNLRDHGTDLSRHSSTSSALFGSPQRRSLLLPGDKETLNPDGTSLLVGEKDVQANIKALVGDQSTGIIKLGDSGNL